MGISAAVIAGTSVASSEVARKRTKKTDRLARQEKDRLKKLEDEQKRIEEESTPFRGTGVANRIGLERQYLRRAGGGRAGSVIKRSDTLG